ncbi:hypothetical protein ONZ51_g10321 [Trametes cubensis]|uniref:Uncharacterized protein n=1 Tax=Trametes cubensis TaxID=1111947 RepID=A0AAD7TJQ0_9APHY|nr:hypothetical protein ONZ51_g10321 [Trametes cubensis]
MSTSHASKFVTLSPAQSVSRKALMPKQTAAISKQPALLRPPQNGPIMACAANLRHLKTSSRKIYRGLRDCRANFLRLTIPHRSTFEAEWATYADRYKNLLDDADLAASQLMAVIKGELQGLAHASRALTMSAVYLVIQSSKNEAPEADMITELGNLQQASPTADTILPTTHTVYTLPPSQTLSGRTYDLRRQCEKIAEDVQASYDRLSKIVETSSVALAHPATGKSGNSTGRNVEPSANDSTNKPSPRPAGSISSYFWKLFSALLSLILPENNYGKETSGDARRDQGQRQDNTKLAKQPARTPSTRQDTQSSQISQTSATSAALDTITEVITGLERQAPLFNAFPELAQHLRNEVDAYLRAFEAAKAYPASRKKALEEAQARVVASSKYWKECLAALNGELSATD